MAPLNPSPTSVRTTRNRFLCGPLAVVCFALLLGAVSAKAQSVNLHGLDVFVEGGGSFFDPSTTSILNVVPSSQPGVLLLSSETVSFQDSGRFFAGGDVWFLPHDAVQVSLAYSRNDVSVSSGTPALQESGLFGTTSRSERILSFDYVHAFPIGRRWKVLTFAGPGAIWFAESYGTVERSFAVNLGAGASFRLTRHWTLRAEYRDFIIKESPILLGGNLFEEDHSPTVGVVFHF